MVKFLASFLVLLFTTQIILTSPAYSNSRLQAISSGAANGGGGDAGEPTPEGVSKKYGRLGKGPAGVNDTVFLGIFEIYLIKKRHNARLTVYAEPRKFLLGHRACTKLRKIRDSINTHLFKNPPETDNKGQVQTAGMDSGIRQAIKAGLKTKLEYFTSIYVINGRHSALKPPKELADYSVTDCAGIIEKKKELDKAAKK